MVLPERLSNPVNVITDEEELMKSTRQHQPGITKNDWRLTTKEQIFQEAFNLRLIILCWKFVNDYLSIGKWLEILESYSLNIALGKRLEEYQ